MNRMLLIVALLGLLVSGYLLVTYVSPIPIVCTSGGGCQVAQASKWAAFFGLPTPFYGVLYYFSLGVLAAIITPHSNKLLQYALFLTTGIGLAVSTYLTYIEAFVIDAWCSWCVASAILATVAFYLVWLHPKGEKTHLE